jgi:hypothetical protein
MECSSEDWKILEGIGRGRAAIIILKRKIQERGCPRKRTVVVKVRVVAHQVTPSVPYYGGLQFHNMAT